MGWGGRARPACAGGRCVHSRRLGRTGYVVSEVGFGGWGLGQSMWRGTSDEEGRAALREALDRGVSFIDTALAYGDGHSEELIAEVLAEGGWPDVVVATKIPPVDYEWPGSADKRVSAVFPARWVRECVEASLRFLDVEALPIEQFHVWNDAWLGQPEWEDTRDTMERLSAEGKVLHWGVSINDHAPETAMRLWDEPLFETAQLIYNVFDRSPERGFLDLARQRELGVIVRVPFDEGALTGAITSDTTFPDGDWRHSYFRGDRKGQVEARIGRLSRLLGQEAGSLPELALRFVLSCPEVSTVIPGMRRPEHARANTAVSDGRLLSPAMLHALEAHAWEKNWYRG